MQPSCWNNDKSIFSRPAINFERIPCFRERNWTSIAAAKDGIIKIRNGVRDNCSYDRAMQKNLADSTPA
jgi:hypothetical protein